MAAKRIKIDNASSKFRRQSQKREQKVIRCSVLIVCEGTKTEPNYFEAFAEKQQGVIVYDIEVKGLGRGTKDVVEKAIDIIMASEDLNLSYEEMIELSMQVK